MAEKYIHDLGDFRDSLSSKLLAHHAISNGFGWAIFGAEQYDGSVAALAPREILLFSRFRPESMVAGGVNAPLIRIITNEPVIYDETAAYLAEEITLFENGNARFLLDAMKAGRGEFSSSTQDGQLVTPSLSPIFKVNDHGQLAITTNSGKVTPVIKIVPDHDPSIPIRPFGLPSDTEDRLFALSRAQDILLSVMDIAPSHHYRRAA